MTPEAARIIAALGLAPLPHEGGFFRQTWVSAEKIGEGEEERAAGSAIYFLLTTQDFSSWHRLRGDEVWHFHAGDVVEHLQMNTADSGARIVRLGSDVLAGDTPQLLVRGGTWQAARLAPTTTTGMAEDVPGGWTLLSCTMTPAWDKRDFELGERDPLVQAFPAAEELIRALTR